MAAQSEIPRIISVDDHLVEPPHVWQDRLPEKFKDAGPCIERRGLAGMRYIGGQTYELDWSDEGDPCDVWIYEDIAIATVVTSPRWASRRSRPSWDCRPSTPVSGNRGNAIDMLHLDLALRQP